MRVNELYDCGCPFANDYAIAGNQWFVENGSKSRATGAVD